MDLATDAEVWRYYEMESRIKLNLYNEEPLPTEPRFMHNGCPRTEVASRMESFMTWYQKDQERRRVKQELPELELKFKRMKVHYMEEIPKIEKAFNHAETVEFLSLLIDKPNGIHYVQVVCDKHTRYYVPNSWDVKKRNRFITYFNQAHTMEKVRQIQKMEKFKQRLKNELENEQLVLKKEQEEAEYQAYKLRHTAVPIDVPTAVPLDPSAPVVEGRWA